MSEEDVGRLGRTDRETEVTDADVSFDVDENVGRLEVAVDDAAEGAGEREQQQSEDTRSYLSEVKWSMADRI